MKFHRITQPPVDRWARPQERRTLWPALLLVIGGLGVGFFGLGRLTTVESTEGHRTFEAQLHLAFAYGGVERAAAVAPQLPPNAPPGFEVPPWVQLQPMPTVPVETEGEWTGDLVVNLGAKDPCPT